MPKNRSRLILIGLILALSLAHSTRARSAPAPTTPQQSTYLVYLKEQADLRPAYHIRDWDARGQFVLDALRQTAQRTQPAVLSRLNGLQTTGHVSAIHPHYVVNLILVRGDETAAQSLAQLPQVAAVYPEIPIQAIAPVANGLTAPSPQAPEWNIQMIRADQVWAERAITGTGIVVANIDSGVYYAHPALVAQYRGNLGGGGFEHDYNWWDPTGDYPEPSPIEGPYPLGQDHGTHTMGVIVGDDQLGHQIGVAPGARWIAAYGFSGIEGLLSATEWMIAPWRVDDFDPNHPTADPSQRPHVVNNSWGAPGGMLLAEPLLQAQRAAGIFATFAAGNSGFDPVTYRTVCGSMISPADNPSGFAVGATTMADTIAPFSSRGPNALRPWLGLYETGPQVSAPGMMIQSSDPPDDYSTGNGTSYASPHVAGTVALLWSAEPDLIGLVDETAEILRGTALPKTTNETCGGILPGQVPNNTFGWGRIDALDAVDMAWQAGWLSGTVTDAGGGAPLPSARVSMERDGHRLSTATDQDGVYRFPLGQGRYTVTVQAYGYAPWVGTGVSLTQDTTTTLSVGLTPLPTYTLSGQVQEGTLLAEGDPVWAKVGARDTPVAVTTTLHSGTYTTSIAQGAYTLRAIARGYQPENRPISVTGDLQENFGLTPRPTYYVRDSRSPCGPAFNWIDATDSITHYLGFQDYAQIYLPATPFPFYSDTYDTYYVSSNGLISFGRGRPAHTQDLPQLIIPFEGPPNNAIYGLMDMLNPDFGNQGTVHHKVVDERYVVIEFYQVEHWLNDDPETFEFVLDTQTGAILIQYLDVSRPDFSTVGVENADGSDGLLYSYHNSGNITNSLAVAFYPVFGPPPADQDPLGVWGSLSGTVYLSGTAIPIPGAAVTATTYLRALTTTAGPAGRYQFADICADLYQLSAGGPDYYPGPTTPARLRWPDDVAVTDLYLAPKQANPSLSKTVSPSQVEYGQTLTYTLSVSNQRDGALSGAVLSDTLPWTVAYLTSTPPGFYRNGILTWSLDLPAGGSGGVTVTGRLSPTAQPDTVISNTAYLVGDAAVLSSTASFRVARPPSPPGPALTKTVAITAPLPGQTITYSLAYANSGETDLPGAVLSDPLPAQVSYLTATPPGFYRGGVLTWSLDLPAGGAGQVIVVGRLGGTALPSATVSNTAYLSWSGGSISSTVPFRVGWTPADEYRVYLPCILKD